MGWFSSFLSALAARLSSAAGRLALARLRASQPPARPAPSMVLSACVRAAAAQHYTSSYHSRSFYYRGLCTWTGALINFYYAPTVFVPRPDYPSRPILKLMHSMQIESLSAGPSAETGCLTRRIHLA
ncbi:hypothetical protein EVAR_266_1 [Eumeta japonica]|uniref:Uncharacterized protein n=1 Tax=Eumeta variegata TaxID=151549 RepID=A0A4C1S9E5_EUMVA|nr:hypothetical protein EVAR_266_1 [Eumeta japonica]